MNRKTLVHLVLFLLALHHARMLESQMTDGSPSSAVRTLSEYDAVFSSIEVAETNAVTAFNALKAHILQHTNLLNENGSGCKINYEDNTECGRNARSAL